MKKYISGLLTGIIIATSLTTFAAVQLKVVPNPYPIFINNSKANVQGYNINGSTYLKLSDLKSAGIDAGYNKDKKQIEVKSAAGSTTKTEPAGTSNTVKYLNPTILFDGDDFKITTYDEYNAIIYNSNTYVRYVDFIRKTNIKAEFNGKTNTYKLYKDGIVILETKDADPFNFVTYEGFAYFNIKFLGKYLDVK